MVVLIVAGFYICRVWIVPSMEEELMVKQTELILYPRKMIKYLGIKTPAWQFSSMLTAEQIKQVSDAYMRQWDESVQVLTQFMLDEQKRYLSQAFVDVNIRDHFRGLEVQDSLSIKRRVAELRATATPQVYDERNCFDLLWAIATLKKRWKCVIGDTERIIKAVSSSVSVEELKIFQAKDFCEDLNYVIPDGQSLAIYV